ncbi:MAG TPA: macro domain-containing protein [Thermodesulfobacteriota bacterium]|nr:macro domain-containing protein [Thermodesulfobacteriota bacterium]
MSLRDKIRIKRGDITEMEVDAIVNAANTDLLLGSGVAGAIRRKGGDLIQKECDKIGSIPLGEAAVTGAGNLKAKYVIHAAGMHIGGGVGEDSLRATTKNSLLRADEKGVRTIAFPAIGTGVGGFPVDECARVMIDTVSEHLKNEKTSIEKVYFVLFDEGAFNAFDEYLKTV